MENCASCHGVEADGVPANGTAGAFPDLVGLGPATIDFWIDSGRMPAKDLAAVEAPRRQPALTPDQALAIAAWVNSLVAGYPYIPTPHLKNANVADGAALFALNCAACHTIDGDGDALAIEHVRAVAAQHPRLPGRRGHSHRSGNMPRFTGNLSDQQVRRHRQVRHDRDPAPENPGGFGLGGLGPVAEGFVGLALGVGLLALIGFWIGDRS